MKKYILLLAVLFMVISCKTEMDRALSSADKNLMLKVANEKFTQKKWKDALTLYDKLTNLVAGTDDYPNVLYNTAYANYYDKVYKVAGSQFKSFATNFPNDPRREEAAYMAALCYYEGSMDYNLDQTNTELAISELQDFLNNYPNSERSKNINQLVQELSYKLEQKSYENARQYYKMAEYKAANVAFENVLNDFPGTKLKPNIMDYIMKSRYELAMNSIYDLKDERLANAVAYTKLVEKELPNSEYSKTAADLRAKLVEEQAKFVNVKKDYETKKAELTAKQKAEEEKTVAKDKEKQQDKKRDEDLKSAQQGLRDSAKAATPQPAATFKIQR